MSRSKRKVNKHVPRRRMLKEPPPKVSGEISLGRETAAVFFFVLSLFLALSLYSFLAYPPGQGMPANSGFLRAPNIMGEVGLATARLLFRLLGWCSFVTVLWSLLLARTIWNDGWPACSRSLVSLFVSTSALFVAAASCAGVASLTFGSQGGGALGSAISVVLVRLVNEPGTVLFCSALFVLSIGVATGSGTGLVVALTQWIVGLGVAGAAWGGRLFSRGFYRGVCVLLVLARRAIREVFYLPVRLVRGLGSPFWRAKAGAQHAGAQSAGPAWVAGIKPEEKGTATASPAFVMAGAGEAPAKASGAAPLILRRSKLGQKKTASPVKPLRKKGARPDKADALKEKGRSGAKSKCGEPEKEFVLPNTDLLVSGEAGAGTSLQDTDLIKNSKKLEVALANFRIGGRVTEVHPGPVITLYQFEPAAGIKVQR
ncbi:MAG TPA: DNA translocase FtsK 4TM domain-containing protein, partial [Oligoflexia bacterium]|nr:DNA translocase FtsK 4TM domain-containing protein [Oligoflexia bacterium]